MYLNRLSKEQKELFLDLCIHTSKIDGVVADEEKRYIQDYCVEMQLEATSYVAKNNLEDVISKIIEISKPTELKIIFFEIMGLVLADKKFEAKEQELIDKLVKRFNLSPEFKEKASKYLNKMIDIYIELNELIFS